jgi:uncharacterized membrane protein
MNWKLIFLLSLFGLAMGIATVFIIPSKIEPLFWLVIFLISAYIIAKRCSNKYFLHGLLVSIANSIWITACHVLLFDQYIANHAREAAMMTSRQMPMSGPLIGVVSGLILGLFAVIASKIVRPSEPLR